MTWIRVHCSGGARYGAPSFSDIPLMEGFDTLMLYPRQIQKIKLFPQNDGNTVKEEDTSYVTVVGQQLELGGRLGLVTVVAGGDDEVSEQQLYFLIESTFFILQRTDSGGVQILLDSLTSRLPSETQNGGTRNVFQAEVDGQRHRGNKEFLVSLREVKQKDDVEPFYSEHPQHKNRVIPLRTIDANHNWADRGRLTSGPKNRDFLLSVCGGGRSGDTPATLSLTTTKKSMPVEEMKPAYYLSRTRAMHRKGFMHFVLQDTVPLSMLFSHTVVVDKSKKEKNTQKPRKAVFKSTEQSNGNAVQPANNSFPSVGSADYHNNNNDSNGNSFLDRSRQRVGSFLSSRSKRKGSTEPPNTNKESTNPCEVLCESYLRRNTNFNETLSTLRDDASGGFSHANYWSEFIDASTEVNTRLVKGIQRLLLEAFCDPAQNMELTKNSLPILQEVISNKMWDSETPKSASSTSAMPFVANFSPSGLLFASPLFFSQLIHSERLILSSTAISKLLCFTPSQPGTNTKNKDESGVFHTYSFPLQAGYDMEKPFLNPIYDIVLLCVGDSLAIVFGFPRERKTPADETGNAELRLERFFTAEKFLQFFNQYFTMDAGDEGNSVSGNDTIVKMQQRLTKQMEILCFTGSQLNINSKIESGSTEFEDALLVLNSVEEFFYNNHMLSSSTLRRKKKGAPRTNNNQQSVPLNDFYANFLNAVDDDEIANERNEPLDLAGENSGVAKKKKKKLTSKMKKGTSNSVVSLIMLCCGKGKNSQAKLLSSEIRDADSFTLEDHPSSVRNSSVLSLENSVSSSVKNSNAISFLPLPLLFIYLASMVTRDELKCFLPFSSLNESVHSLFWNVRHLAEVEEENKKGKSKTKDNGNTTTTGEQGVSTLTRNNNATVLGQYSVSFFRPQMSHATVSSQGATLFSNQPTFASPHTMYRVVHLPNRLLYYFSADRVYNRQHIGEKHPEEEETGKKGAKPKQTDEKGEQDVPAGASQQTLYHCEYQVSTFPMDALNSITALPLDEQDHYKKCHGRLAAQVSDSSSSTDDEEDILSDAVLKTVYVNYPYRVNASNCNLVRRVRQNSNNSGRVSAAVSDTCWVNMECLLSLRDTSTVRNAGESIHGQSIFQDCVVGAGTAEQNLVSCVQCRKAHINSAMRSALEKTPVNSSSSNTANHNTRDDTYSYLLSAGDANGPRFYHQLNLKQYTMLCREVVLLQQAVHAFFDGIQTQ